MSSHPDLKPIKGSLLFVTTQEVDTRQPECTHSEKTARAPTKVLGPHLEELRFIEACKRLVPLNKRHREIPLRPLFLIRC